MDKHLSNVLPLHLQRASLIALAIISIWPLAGQAQGDLPVKALSAVVVTATRSEAEAADVAGAVSAVTKEDIERKGARDLRSILADEPDVTVPSDSRRFGGGQVNIRGIEGNRILMLTDGVRVTDYRAAGTSNYDAASRDVPFAEFLKQVEIVRGPASSLYGSDAIGGVMGFITLDPADLLKGRSFAVGGQTGYYSADNSKRLSAWVASGNERFQSLLMVGTAKGDETDNKGSSRVQGNTRTAPNPLDYTQSNVLGKLLFTPTREHRIKLTVEHKESESDVDVQRVANGTSLARVSSNTGIDSMQRDRMQLDYEYLPEAGWFDSLALKLYTQKETTDNQNRQLRSKTASSCSSTTVGTMNCLVNNRYDYEQTHTGFGLQQRKAFTFGLPQEVVWGLDFDRAETEETTYTTWTNLATGAVSNTLLGYTYPVSYFPAGHTDQLGLFAQDEIRAGNLHITPGLRFDRFSLKPETTGLYVRTDGKDPASKSGSHVSPKLSLLYDLKPDWNVYAQYVEGFRGPNYEEVNRYFVNGSSAYGVVGNADLKPETSRGLELGSKYTGSRWGAQFSVFQTHYKNFIDYSVLGASDSRNIYVNGTRYSTYLYQNLASVVIRGADWGGYWQVLPSLRLNAAFAIANGYDATSKAPLNSIEPKRATLAAAWTPSETWGGEWRLRAATGKNRIDTSSTKYFRTPGYGVNDVSAWWQFRPGSRLNLAVNNVFDKTWYQWSDVRLAGLTATDGAPAFYSQPGRNFAITLKLEY